MALNRFPFCFRGATLVLLHSGSPVPGHCLPFNFVLYMIIMLKCPCNLDPHTPHFYIGFGFGLVLSDGKQFFSHVGTEPSIPGYYQYFFFFGGGGGGGKYVLLKDTTRRVGDPSGARTADLWIRSPRC